MYKILSCLLLVITMLSCKESPKAVVNTGLIPLPSSIKLEDQFSDVTTLELPSDFSSTFPDMAAFIAEAPFLKSIKVSGGSPNIKLVENAKIAHEAYAIQIAKKEVTVSFSDKSGLQNALVTLSQLQRANTGSIPIGLINDAPRFGYRGMHLDVGRHFFGPDDVKKYIDYLAAYKFNTFHWHLTEDQGWRIEIKKYPKLTEIGAFRDQTIVGHNNAPDPKFDGTRYGGFYTQDQVKDIVAYATERNIEVIPEIELPGHSSAALAAYPQLGCGPGPYKVITRWGVFTDIFCPKEETFAFLQDVFDEVIPLFPSKYIHIGGDEAPKDAWKESAFAQDLIKKEGLKDEHGLQSYFIQRIEKYLNSKGKQIIGWDEILEGGLAPNATVMSWRGEEGGIAAARQDHNVIMTPSTYVYLDYYQADKETEPLAIGGLLTVKDVYNWEPLPKELEASKHKYILGGQANVWTEYIPTMDYLEYMVLARMTAVSEVLWSRAEDKNYDNYVTRLRPHVDFWKGLGVNFADHALKTK